MSRLLKWLRSIFIWTGPLAVLLLAVASGFGYWVLGTPAGTRWALITVAEQFEGQASGISGSVLDGFRVGHYSLVLPGTNVRLEDFHLQALWHELVDGSLHIADLSAGSLQLDLQSSGEETPGEPFSMPPLPVRLAIDSLAVDELEVTLDGEPLPVQVGKLSTSLALNQSGAQLVIRSLDVGHEQLKAALSGEVKLLDLSDPWPLQAQLTANIEGQGNDSPLCAHRYLPALGEGDEPQSVACTLDIDTTLDGSLEAMHVVLNGNGQGMKVDVDANLTPRGVFPLKDAVAALKLADGSGLQAKVNWATSTEDAGIRDRLTGTVSTDKLNVGQLVGDVIPDLLLTMAADFDVELLDHTDFQQGRVDLDIREGSRWNKQALAGHLKSQIVNSGQSARTPVAEVEDPAAQAKAGIEPVPDVAQDPLWKGLRLAEVDMDLRLGKNRLKADGALGMTDSRINLDLSAPDLDAFWPDLPGGAELKGVVAGELARHEANLRGQYTPEQSREGGLGKAPMRAHIALEGSWGRADNSPDSPEGWRGTLTTLEAEHASLGLKAGEQVPISFFPGVLAPAWQWQVGSTRLELLMSSRNVLTLQHQASRGGEGRWETQGAIDRLQVSQRLIDDIQKLLEIPDQEKLDRGGVKLRNAKANAGTEIVLAADWNLRFAGALAGQANIKRVSGDVMVPAEPPFPLGLETMELAINAQPTQGATSRITADLLLRTKKMGRIKANATTLLHSPDGQFSINPKDTKVVNVDADIGDLGWTSLFLDDSMELGGAVQARLQLQSQADGSWRSSGTINGQKIRVVRIDDGIRLLDGTLSARLEEDRLILEELSFPALLRVEPKEWRTAEWVSTNPEAKDGKLVLTGEWYLFESRGVVDINLHRYPILQRSDRYAMISGKLRLSAQLPSIAISGSITADAGWFGLDMLGGIPTLDGDVVVLRPGQEQVQPSVPMDISMDLEVDLGKRFYLTGYGVNSGLVGNLRISMIGDKLTGVGALRTRGGAIEAYGQRLQLRRGTITFQGDITSPTLDIEALRTGLAVEAGVRVAGTARRPRIDLVSYPAVSEIEKLSWLLLGHGPDDSGGDVALLFSVGTSFLGDGEPFYRKFGIDELSMRSGELGAAGSILPAESVVSGLDSGTSDIERKFIQVSKAVGGGVTLSIRQALSDTGTVGRASYRLARGLTAEISAGTVNGLALIYRWFSRD
ncbi:translocation/assembly module TamB domain-containing protein [Pusillimonas sp. MFBS29]|uniref:translocation/assembly module TamB domain-containing protein n=1 Tax=Pusillimonas sp. MFBS29 TaxID=2886690 RepID=UPI001D0F9268|nr:translocation/assembly module TamB domain-containing protein [Pusillimonas sp. MFBS29]MCC2594774.1 translocation/assembly module TamB domain-containing protein [Pusillimonas sp. MFBS29]